MHITGMVHININCSDFERSKAFYEMLGFQVYWPVPETNTEEVANAVGMPKYQVQGALMALQSAEQPMVIDLLEWKSPRDDSPPYPNLYRPGLARIRSRVQTSTQTLSFSCLRALRWCPNPSTSTPQRQATLGSFASKTLTALF